MGFPTTKKRVEVVRKQLFTMWFPRTKQEVVYNGVFLEKAKSKT